MPSTFMYMHTIFLFTSPTATSSSFFVLFPFECAFIYNVATSVHSALTYIYYISVPMHAHNMHIGIYIHSEKMLIPRKEEKV